MNIYCYRVLFGTNQSQVVDANCEAEAIILAQAKQIEAGCQYMPIKEIYKIK